MIDLDAEFMAALRAVGWDDAGTAPAQWLAARGLDARRRLVVGGIGVLTATLHQHARLFEAHPDGERLLIVPVLDRLVEGVIEFGEGADAEIADLVGWQPARPDKLFTRRGEAAIVGAGGVAAAIENGLPLQIFRSVEDLVRHGGELGVAGEPLICGVHGETTPRRSACVILDLRAAVPLLRDVAEIVCDDLEHAEAIDRAIRASLPRAPRISLPAPERRAA